MNVFMKWTIASVFLCISGLAHAQNVHGVLRVVKGDVQIKSGKSGETAKARLGAEVYPKDVIITGKDARAKIVMVDNNEINVSPESQIEIQHYEYDPSAGKKDVTLNVIYGKVRSKVEQKYDGKTTKFQIKTPSAVAGVRGTDFLTSFDRGNGQSQITTFQGRVEFGTPGPGGSIANPVFVGPGTQATSVAGSAPTPPAPVPKEQLAKMDKDTKADTAGGGKNEGGNGERQPANDKKDKGDKADGDKKGDDGGKGGDKNGDNGKKGDDGGKKAEGGGSGPKAGGGDVANADGSDGGKSKSGGATTRDPASNGPGGGPNPGDNKTGGGCSMCGAGPGPDDKNIIITPPPPPPPPPTFTQAGPRPCDFCNSVIQGGNAPLTIKVHPK
jgi:hypothetical protein